MNTTNEGSAKAAAESTKLKSGVWDYADKNAENGRSVFPVHPGCAAMCGKPECARTCAKAKTPLVAGGFKAATTDPATLADWRAKWPDAMLGMPTGEKSGFAVVDLDMKHGQNGEKALREYLAEQGEQWPETLTVETPSGGKHLIFQDIPSSKSRTGVLPGVDTRGNGGYVVVPPSKHTDGGVYRMANSAPCAKPSPAIERLLKDGLPKVEKPKSTNTETAPPREKTELDGRYAAKALKGEAAAVRGAPDGERNHRLNVAAVKAGHYVPHLIDRAEVEAELTAAALAAGLGEEETAKTIASGLAKGMAEPEWPPAEIVPATAAEDFSTPEAMAGFERYATSIGKTVSDLQAEALAVAARVKSWGFDNLILKTLRAETVAQLLAGGIEKLPPRSWELQGFLLRDAFVLIGGPGGSGKSSLMNGCAFSIAAGLPYMGFEPRNPNGEAVLILNRDDDQAEIARRFAAFALKYNVPATALDRVHVLGMDRLGDARARRVEKRTGELLMNGDWFDWLAGEIARTGAKVVFIDPLFGFADLDENSNSHMGRFGGYLNKFAKEQGVCVVLVHHANKSGVAAAAANGGEQSAGSIAGGGRLVDAARAAFVVMPLSDVHAGRVGMHKEDARFKRMFGCWNVKSNYTARGEALAYFETEGVCLNNPKGLDPADIVGVAVRFTPPKAAASDAVLLTILELIDRGLPGVGPYARSNKGGSSRYIVPAIVAGVDWIAEGLPGTPAAGSVLDILDRKVLGKGLAEEGKVKVRYKSKEELRNGIELTAAGKQELERLRGKADKAEHPFG